MRPVPLAAFVPATANRAPPRRAAVVVPAFVAAVANRPPARIEAVPDVAGALTAAFEGVNPRRSLRQ